MKSRLILFLTIILCGCSSSPRMTVVTGTIIGLHASPGDGSSRPPEITFAYKRSELALIPTAGAVAVDHGTTTTANTDTSSSFSLLDTDIHWFGTSLIQQIFATGHASRALLTNTNFTTNFAGVPTQ